MAIMRWSAAELAEANRSDDWAWQKPDGGRRLYMCDVTSLVPALVYEELSGAASPFRCLTGRFLGKGIDPIVTPPRA